MKWENKEELVRWSGGLVAIMQCCSVAGLQFCSVKATVENPKGQCGKTVP